MPILDLQKRARELGRIRLGQKGDRGQPQKLDRFRFTSNSQALLTKIAELYGGEVRAWEGGTQAFELVSNSDRVPIMVPPQPITQWHEAWRASGCIHRCDGRTNVLTDEPCDPDDPAHIEAMAKPTTRLNVVLRDVEGIGVWRVETHGWNAAVEIPDAAEFLAYAGGYVNGWLALEQRSSIERDGDKVTTHRYLVPIIEIDVTPTQLMSGRGRVAAPPMIGGPAGQTPALAAAGPDYVALAADLTTGEEINDLWQRARDAGHMTQGLDQFLRDRAAEIKAAGGQAVGAGADRAAPSPHTPDPAPDGDGVVDAELVEEPDPDVVWAEIVKVAGELGDTLPQVQDDVAAFLGGTTAGEASGAELQSFLDSNLLPRLQKAAS
jgi:hypothetical protein